MDDNEKLCIKLERKKFKLECKIEAINDELYHLRLIQTDHDGKLNKKRTYRREHLERVLLYYYEEIEEYRQEIERLKKIN